MIRNYLLLILTCAWFGNPAAAQIMSEVSGVQARVRLESFQVQVGKPVWARFVIENMSDEPVTLMVPGTEPEIPLPEVGLPLAHIFSGSESSGVSVTTESGRRWEKPSGFHKSKRAPILMIAPHSLVGAKIDLREFFPTLRAAGRYRIGWECYGGAVKAQPVSVLISLRQDVELTTDDGKMTIRLFYEDAPNNVANFIELVKSGFYDGTTFHRLEPGYLIQGGCSRGDGTGIRPDGKRVDGEFNARINDKGSVAMALLGDDPSSASSQFFIGNTRMRDWDGRYTVFGHLVGEHSMETLDNLMATPVDEQGQPLRVLRIRQARLTTAPADSYDDLP